jgi:hypothetical protein
MFFMLIVPSLNVVPSRPAPGSFLDGARIGF